MVNIKLTKIFFEDLDWQYKASGVLVSHVSIIFIIILNGQEAISGFCVLITVSMSRLMHTRHHSPSLTEVTCAAALASAGHLTRLDCLVLEELSLEAVPAGDLASLARCVRGVEARA